jgi:hypothetical protein
MECGTIAVLSELRNRGRIITPLRTEYSPQSNYPSDNTHNWTGNYLALGNSALRFYGSGPRIWYNTSANGFTWTGYVNTNINGGDPTVVKLGSSSFLLIFVGPPYSTDIAAEDVPLPSDVELYQNYPNPFNAITTIAYALSHQSSVSLKVFDLLGREVATLVNGPEQQGVHSVTFDASSLSSGVYIFRLQTGRYIVTRRMLLLK